MTWFEDKPTLTASLVTLVPIVADHAGDMLHDLDDAEALRLTGTHGSFEPAVVRTWCETRCHHDDRLDLAILDRATNAWAGEVVINELDTDNQSCSFRIAVSASARDRGFGTEATDLIVDHVFSTTPMYRIWLEVYAFNTRAIAVYEKLGFAREGTLRGALLWDGERIDAHMMSLVRPDWAPS